MSGVPPAQWPFSEAFGGYFWYHAATDQIILQDGRRIPRPEAAPRTTLLQLCPQPVNVSAQTPGSPSSSRASLASPALVARSIPGQHNGSRQQPIGAAQRQPTVGQQGSSSDNHKALSTSEGAGRSAADSASAHHGPSQGIDQSSLDQIIKRIGLLDVQSAQSVVAPNQIPQPQIQTTRADETGRYVSTWDSQSGVRTIRQVGPPMSIPTDPYLKHFNMFARQMLIGTEEEEERLFPLFRKPQHPARFFTVGKVFLVLWVEPAGESVVTYLQAGETTGRFGERVYSKVRRFVVIRQQSGYCSALPITTYGRRGVSKPGVIKSEHAIIHTGSQAPEPLNAELPHRGEAGMRSRAIRVDPDERDTKLDLLSRLDFGKITTIQHNLKVKSFGKVNRASMDALERQAQAVWEKIPESGSLPGPSSVPSVSSGPGTAIHPPVPLPQTSNTKARQNGKARDSGIGLEDSQASRRALDDLKDESGESGESGDSEDSGPDDEGQEADSLSDAKLPSRAAAASPPARTAIQPPPASVVRRTSEQNASPSTRLQAQPSSSAAARRSSDQDASYSYRGQAPRETDRPSTRALHSAQIPRTAARPPSVGSAGQGERRPSTNTTQGATDQVPRQPARSSVAGASSSRTATATAQGTTDQVSRQAARPSGAGTGSSRHPTSGQASRTSQPQ